MKNLLCSLLFLVEFPWLVLIITVGFPLFIIFITLDVIAAVTTNNYEFERHMMNFIETYEWLMLLPFNIAMKLIKE
jgi:hypothetical protein